MTKITSSLFIAVLISLLTCADCVIAETWSVIPSGTSSRLTALTLPFSNVVYVAGAKSTLLRTLDLGLSWTQQQYAVGFSGSLFGVATLDTSFTLATGESGVVQYQFQGIKKWNSPTQSITQNTFNAVSLTPWTLDSTSNAANDILVLHVVRFIAVGDNGQMEYLRLVHYVRHYLDGGVTVNVDSTYLNAQQQIVPTGFSLRAMAFDQTRGYVAGDSGVVLVSTNQGNTWTAKNVGKPVTLNAVWMLSAGTALAVGKAGAMWLTTDGGATWSNKTPAGLSENLNGMSFVDANTGVIVGDNGLIIKTTDGGATWARQAVNTFLNLNAVNCYQGVDGNDWIAVGDSGTIVQTLYGGLTVEFNKNRNAIDFGAVPVNTRTSDSVMINNSTGLTSIAVSASSTDPAIHVTPDRMILDQGSSRSFKIQYTPRDTSSHSAWLVLHHDASWIPDSVRISGHGVAAILTVVNDTLDFGIADKIKHVIVWLRNTGNISLDLTSIAIVDTADFNVAFSSSSIIAPGDSVKINLGLNHVLSTDIISRLIIKSNSIKGNDTVIVKAKAYHPVGVVDGVAPFPHGMFIECHPNPITDAATISFESRSADQSRGAGTLSVVDMYGREVKLVWQGMADNSVHDIFFSMRDLPNGCYMIRFTDGMGYACKMISVVR